MKKNFLRRKGDISGIIVALIFVVICLVIIPAFKSLQNSNTSNAKKAESTYSTFVSGSLSSSVDASLENPYE